MKNCLIVWKIGQTWIHSDTILIPHLPCIIPLLERASSISVFNEHFCLQTLLQDYNLRRKFLHYSWFYSICIHDLVQAYLFCKWRGKCWKQGSPYIIFSTLSNLVIETVMYKRTKFCDLYILDCDIMVLLLHDSKFSGYWFFGMLATSHALENEIFWLRFLFLSKNEIYFLDIDFYIWFG